MSGELKIPGYSTYLHPISPDYVLGVGQDATDQGMTLGLKVSLFKVADPANPTEVATWTLPDANSPAEWDHRAFQWLADRNLAIVPTQTWAGESGAVLLRVDDETITEVGTVSHEEAISEPTSDCDPIDTSSLGEENELFLDRPGGRGPGSSTAPPATKAATAPGTASGPSPSTSCGTGATRNR